MLLQLRDLSFRIIGQRLRMLVSVAFGLHSLLTRCCLANFAKELYYRFRSLLATAAGQNRRIAHFTRAASTGIVPIHSFSLELAEQTRLRSVILNSCGSFRKSIAVLRERKRAFAMVLAQLRFAAHVARARVRSQSYAILATMASHWPISCNRRAALGRTCWRRRAIGCV